MRSFLCIMIGVTSGLLLSHLLRHRDSYFFVCLLLVISWILYMIICQ